jgi:hypothetical protein
MLHLAPTALAMMLRGLKEEVEGKTQLNLTI